MEKNLKNCSKFLSLVLRHKPDALGIKLDPNGWANVEELIHAANKQGKDWSRELIEEVVTTNDKKRFSFSEDGLSIRANQGHSLKDVIIELSPTQPPDVLYHGTVEKFLEPIMANGLSKMQRQHVHLSADVETAKSVGSRRGKPVILRIDSKAMYEAGHEFFISENKVWLTEKVLPEFLEVVNS